MDLSQLTLVSGDLSSIPSRRGNSLSTVLLHIRSITEVEDYGMEDVKQIVRNDTTNYKFTADPILSLNIFDAPIATQFTVSAKSAVYS